MFREDEETFEDPISSWDPFQSLIIVVLQRIVDESVAVQVAVDVPRYEGGAGDGGVARRSKSPFRTGEIEAKWRQRRGNRGDEGKEKWEEGAKQGEHSSTATL